MIFWIWFLTFFVKKKQISRIVTENINVGNFNTDILCQLVWDFYANKK